MAYPQLSISAAAAKRVRNHDCWVFRDELLEPPPPCENGDVVELTDRHGTFLAYAFYSPASRIAARPVSTDRRQLVDTTLLSQRLNAALARRAGIRETNAKRLVFSEADRLPGLIVDQYGQALVIQIRTAGMERWKSLLVDLLRDAVRPTGILERSDQEFRQEEGLPPAIGVLAGAVPDRIQIEEDGLRFWVDPYRGQKTGFYLDQRETRRRIREQIAAGARVADVFAYTGGFGIGAAARGASAVCVEQQEPALALARENAALNRVADRVEFVAADAFYWLEAKAAGRERFDWVLLDPPSLAKTKAETPKGRRALHHLLVHALGLLADEGRLLLSVCTYHLLGVVEDILRIAAAERGIRLRMLGTMAQPPDHPWVLQLPATRYLTSWMAQRE
jgi:23S rRNA (cytosine1962-C5)-methyltransferase